LSSVAAGQNPAVPPGPACDNTGMARRRRRALWVLLLSGLVFVLVFGRGLGLLPTAGQDGERAAAADTPPSAPPSAPPVPGPEAATAAAGLSDRLQSKLSVVRAAASQGTFAEGFRVLAELGAQPQPPAAARAIRQSRDQLQVALAAALGTLADRLRAGQVLAARQQLQALLAGNCNEIIAGVRALAAAAGWPDLTRAELPGGHVPRAEPLPAQRLVHGSRDGSDLRAVVVDSRPHEVTVRVEDARGITYPSLPVVAVEPVEPTPAEAAEMALAALAAGDGVLARLWLAFALGAGPPAPDSRLLRVQELLR